MQELESKLKKLKLRVPTQELDDRVLNQADRWPKPAFAGRRGVSFGWTVAVALFMGIIGFTAGATWRGKQVLQDTRPLPTQVIHVIYHLPPSQNPFDFTTTTHNLPEEKWVIKNIKTGGI